ncbi:hypothetical protein BDP27DRAFT_1431364 [Rhodocollybia butyracea]|uniref:Uncharacterized protein n=1 Tax=Rhodocollybia butyracea TaxID=206335 RepID=A0A9P5TY48_9AGAR|nr:hypothetical protein BDP27DRAFT_1431364 [Rhodocollybia butyracea]
MSITRNLDNHEITDCKYTTIFTLTRFHFNFILKMSTSPKVKISFQEWKEYLDKYFHEGEPDKDDEEEQRLYLRKQEERELAKQAEKLKCKKEADRARAAARAMASSNELDPDDTWQWDGEVRVARLLEKCPLTGEYVWRGQYKQHLPGGKWKVDVLGRCKMTGKYIWPRKGYSILLGPEPQWYGLNGPTEEIHACLPTCTA